VLAFHLLETACIGIKVREMLQDLGSDNEIYILHSARSSRKWQQTCRCEILNNQSLILIRVTFQHHCQPDALLMLKQKHICQHYQTGMMLTSACWWATVCTAAMSCGIEAPCVSPYVLFTVAGAPCDRLMLLLNVPLLAAAFTLIPLGLDTDCTCRTRPCLSTSYVRHDLHVHEAMCA